jgi:hypothetical protein
MAAALGWGLWNERLTEWFNPGGRRPYVKSREEAERMRRAALRQYPIGTWELREYMPEDDEDSSAGGEAEEPATDRPGAARPDTERLAAPRRGA